MLKRFGNFRITHHVWKRIFNSYVLGARIRNGIIVFFLFNDIASWFFIKHITGSRRLRLLMRLGGFCMGNLCIPYK